MPILIYNPTSYLNFRYLYEFDYIPKSSLRNSSNVRKSRTDQEAAIYARLMPMRFFFEVHQAVIFLKFRMS